MNRPLLCAVLVLLMLGGAGTVANGGPYGGPRAPAFAPFYPGGHEWNSGWSRTREGREGNFGFTTRDPLPRVIQFYRVQGAAYGLASQPIPPGGRRPVYKAKGPRGDVSIFSDPTTQNRLYIQVVWTELKKRRP